MSTVCLNCASPITQHYCANCGQKSSTHRYSIQHFFAHDLVHGVFHIDKGILFTIKELFTRPGHSVRDYIQGKRANYFSFVTLILLILAASSFLAPYTHTQIADLLPKASKEMMNTLEKFMSSNPKLVLIITIPIYSLFSFVWFRKAKLNYSEHLVLNSYRIIPELIIGLVMTVLTIFDTNTKILAFAYVIVVSAFGFIYSSWFYYQFFSAYYTNNKKTLVLSIFVPLSYMFLSFLIGVVFAIVRVLQQ